MTGAGQNPDAGTNRFAYATYGGCDIQIAIGHKVLMNAQAISYAVTRNKAPIHVLGSASPKGFGRGIRGIAGSMVLTQFDEHGMASIWNSARFAADATENAPWGEGAPPELRIANPSGFNAEMNTGYNQSAFQNEEDDWASGVQVKSPWYMDQLLSADITVFAANEYGSTSVLRIYGAEWLNEAWGMSVEDTNSETQSTYVATALHPWTRISNKIASQLGTPPTGLS